MPRKQSLRQAILSILSVYYDVSRKEIGAGAGIQQKAVSQHLRQRGALKDEVFERLLAAIQCPPAAVPIVTACIEALDSLDQDGDLTAEELAEIEQAVLVAARLTREALVEPVRRSRDAPGEGYPDAHEAFAARRRAAELFRRLVGLSPEMRLEVVRVAEEYQTWALCELVCHTSEREASRDVERAAAWARLGQEIAERVRGPEEWRNRMKGYAGAYSGNVLRISGELKTAEAAFAGAKRLWISGSDPEGILDPGRILDLEASLRRDQRRLDEALALLDEAVAVGRSPERALIKKGFTLELMGEYERAVETLLRAAPLVDRQADPLLWYNQRFNLAVNYCHLCRCSEAADLVPPVRDLAVDLGDEIFLIRVTWLEGRIAVGLGRSAEGRGLLAQARREFDRRGMSYDVALALLEEAVLLLDEGRLKEVEELAGELTRVFESRDVHREALAALRLFREATGREEVTAELARRVLRYLFRARYDQGLRFES